MHRQLIIALVLVLVVIGDVVSVTPVYARKKPKKTPEQLAKESRAAAARKKSDRETLAGAPLDLRAHPVQKSGRGWTELSHDWTLGPTGARGWMWSTPMNENTTRPARQILVTEVETGSPADGVLKIGDVILGVGDKAFDSDARVVLGQAIVQAETIAAKGVLRLMRWRSGRTANVEITIKVMGSYSKTSPYDCPKTQKIIDNACAFLVKKAESQGDLGSGITGALNALGLLATGRPEYLPLVKKTASMVAAKPPAAKGLENWGNGFSNLLLTEYHLATRDKSVLPAIRAYTARIIRAQSVMGNWGHSYRNKVTGSCPGYGALNAAGQTCLISMILADKCGISDPLLNNAILRSLRFFSSFTGKGAIPYGDHAPADSDRNGKSSQAAIYFDLAGRKVDATWHAKLSVISYGRRELGHTGNFFSFVWGPLGAARCGERAYAAHLKQLHWFYDLERRWDGSMRYQGRPGARIKGHKYGKWDCTGARLLMLCYPLRKVYITGRQDTVVDPLPSSEVAAMIRGGREDFDKRSRSELLSGCESWYPYERAACAEKLAELGDKEIPALIAKLSKGDYRIRAGACLTLAAFGPKAARATEPLARQLDVRDVNLRIAALKALKAIGKGARPAVPRILALARTKIAGDPYQLVKREIVTTLFGGKNKWKSFGLLHAKSGGFDGQDRKAIVMALKSILTDVDHNWDLRAIPEAFEQLAKWDVRELAPIIPHVVDLVRKPRTSGMMGAGHLPRAGFELLGTLGVKEGLDAWVDRIDGPDMNWWPVAHSKCMPRIAGYYGVYAKRYLSRLRAIKGKSPVFNPKKKDDLHKQVDAALAGAIADIEKTTAVRKLVSMRELRLAK